MFKGFSIVHGVMIWGWLILGCAVGKTAYAGGGMDFYIQSKLLSQSQLKHKTKEEREGTYFQRVDHHDPLRKKYKYFGRYTNQYFPQRYFIQSNFAATLDAPVLYIVCGEGVCSGTRSIPAMQELAKKLGAHLIAIEHRYYGYSQPFSRLTTKNLRYLTMDQAIEDLANFQRYAQAVLGYTGNWIVVGGSYAGSLAAFYRMRHPDLVAGAVASSAPVMAKDDFFEYDRHMAQVAGPDCRKSIQAAVSRAEEKLKTEEGKKALRVLFQSEAIKDDIDVLYVIADMAAYAVQYGFRQEFCDSLAEGFQSDLVLEKYAEKGLEVFSRFGITPVMDSFQGVESDRPSDYLGFAGLRSWFYQSCTEVGYFQNANPDRLMTTRSTLISLPYHLAACKRIFGPMDPKLQLNVIKTNELYFDRLKNRDVNQILFTNGSEDPWSVLSILSDTFSTTPNPGLSIFMIPDASHSDDLGTRLSVGLNQARDLTESLVRSWLGL